MNENNKNSESIEPKKPVKLEVPDIKKEPILIFQYNDLSGDYEELEIEEDFPLSDLLDSDFSLLFVDATNYRVWIWHGRNVTTRMKFIAARLSPKIRDQYGIAYKITAVDEGNETLAFKIMIGLEEEIDYEAIQTGPAYMGKEEDLELLEELTREKILLLLEKSGIPEGYERKMVIVKNQLFGYQELDKTYMGSVIKEKQLIPLKEKVEDGAYLAKGLIPRMLFSFNNVVLTELLAPIDDKNK